MYNIIYMLNHKITRLQNIFFIHPNIYSYSSHFRPSFSKKSPFIFHVGINLLSCENCHFVTCHFHFDFNVRKKRKVRNILIINILYINIYFFCFQFLEKWQVTSDNLPITTFDVLVLSTLRAQICHFPVSLFRELSLFDCNQKCTDRAILGVNR